MQERTRAMRIEARIAPDILAMVKRAAELDGRSVSDFVVAAARDAAMRTIDDIGIIRLSVEDQRLFAEALINPAVGNAPMRSAALLHTENVEMR